MLQFHDIQERIWALRSYPWIYKDPKEKAQIYKDGFMGLTREGKDRGPTAETVRLWCIGERIPSIALLTNMLAVINEDMLAPPPLTLDKLSSSFPIAEFYATLYADEERANDHMFTQWAQHDISLCNSFTFPNAPGAERFSQFHSPGLYVGERWTESESASPRQMFAVAVHRKVAVSTNAFNRIFFIPARLTLASKAGRHLYLYLGALGAMENGIEWAFFEQGRAPRDRVRIMTTRGDSRTDLPYTGAMLTMTEGPDYKPVTYSVAIKRVADLPSLEGIRKFLEEIPLTQAHHVNAKPSRATALRKSPSVKRKAS